MERKLFKLLGFNIDIFNMEESINWAKHLIDSNKSSHIITINPEIIQASKKNPDLAKILHEAELVIPDGIGVEVGLKINGIKAKRIAGIEFAKNLLKETASNGISVGFLGAKPHVLQKACKNLKKEIPELNIVYTQDGYFDDKTTVIKDLKEKNPKLLLVAIGAPKQEELIYELKSILPATVMIGVGGSFDVWAGEVKRAPEFWQKYGIEWLYRTLKQPERLRRIFPTLPIFFCNIIKEKYIKKED